MGLAHSPKIVTDGLAFIYDTGSGKSYKGEPTVNVVANPLPTAGWSTANAQGSAITRTYLEEDGKPFMRFSAVTNGSDYPRVTNSVFANSATITGTFSTSLEVRGTAGAVLRFRIYQNGSTKITNSITLTSEWTRYTFDNQTTGFNLNQPYFNPATSNATYDIRNIQVEAKGHSTQFVDGTRSATQGLLDLTNTATIDISNVSFDSNAQMTFDGTNDYASLGNPTAFRDLAEGAIETVYYRDASSGTYQMVFTDVGSDLEITYLGNTLQFYIGNSGLSYTHAVTDQWFNVVGTWSSGFKKLYINGVEVASGTNTGTDTGNRDRYVGGRGANFPFNGKIPIARIYDRALTADEILQNYNAFKSRFL